MADNVGGVSYKEGVVHEAKPGFARVRFDDVDGLVTQWLPVIYRQTLLNKEVYTLDVGEHVACVLDANFEAGCVLGAIYSDADVPTINSPDKYQMEYSDGSWLQYDRATHELKWMSVGTMHLHADVSMRLTAPKIWEN